MRRLAAALAVTALLCGCETTPAPSAAADPLHGSLLQFRRDSEARRLNVRLTADDAGTVVESLTLAADGFRPAPAWQGPAELPVGRALDLPVTLTTPDCTVEPTDVAASVVVRGLPDPLLVPLDDGGLLARLHAGECADEALLHDVRIEVAALDEVRVHDGPALRATVRLTRLAGEDDVRVVGAGPNTVYAITPAGDLPTLGADGSVDVLLDLVPSRCDVHALGESYRTSLVDLRVAVGEAEPRTFVFAPADDVRRRIERFAVDTCRARGG